MLSFVLVSTSTYGIEITMVLWRILLCLQLHRWSYLLRVSRINKLLIKTQVCKTIIIRLALSYKGAVSVYVECISRKYRSEVVTWRLLHLISYVAKVHFVHLNTFSKWNFIVWGCSINFIIFRYFCYRLLELSNMIIIVIEIHYWHYLKKIYWN